MKMFGENIREYIFDVEKINSIKKSTNIHENQIRKRRKIEKNTKEAIIKIIQILKNDDLDQSDTNEIQALISIMCVNNDVFWDQYLTISDYLAMVFDNRKFSEKLDIKNYDLNDNKFNKTTKLHHIKCYNITEDSVNFVASKLSNHRKLLLIFWCRLISNISYCHLAITPVILDRMFSSQYDQHDSQIIDYYLTYGMYILCNEELNTNALSIKDRYCFDSRIVARLPISFNRLETNPYFPTTIHKKHFYNLPRMMDSPEYRGLYSLESFQIRLNIITNNLFVGFDWNNVLLCGSTVQACLFRNPLETIFGINLSRHMDNIYEISGNIIIKKNNIELYWKKNADKFLDYYNEYYNNDIDLIVNVPEYEFDDKIESIYLHVCSVYPEAVLEKIKTNKNYKFKITGIPIIIELFRIFVGTYYNRILTFHLPMVRNYYNGNYITITATSICSAYSGAFYEYHYLGNINLGSSIAEKYYKRGFYPVLNKHEIEQILKNQPILEKYKYISMSNPLLRNGSSLIQYIEDFYDYKDGYKTNTDEGLLLSPKTWIYDKYLNR